jgi:BirA family biotin operon repressor/biotin-[acetyl-CoA-carboxylase] ligase
MWLDLGSVEARLETQFIGRRVVYLTSTGSTQDVARGEAESDAPAGSVVLAEEQTAGRGRFGRRWVSPSGKNLYFTLIMRPPLERLRSLSIIAPLAVAMAVEESTGISARIKWPNDVLVNDRKLSGILIESELSGQSVKYALVGMGVNVNFDVEEAAEVAGIATSVKRELGHETSREELFAALLNQFEVLYEMAARGPEVLQEWRGRLETLGRQIKITFGGHVEDGVAEDVDGDGNLILLRADGSRVAIEAGEVTLRS